MRRFSNVASRRIQLVATGTRRRCWQLFVRSTLLNLRICRVSPAAAAAGACSLRQHRRSYRLLPQVWESSSGNLPTTSNTSAHPEPLPSYRLAVLPLANLSSDPEDDYLADGMTQEFTARLSRIGGLRVIAHSSVAQYAAGDKSAIEIGRELSVGAFLAGTVHKAGGQVIISCVWSMREPRTNSGTRPTRRLSQIFKASSTTSPYTSLNPFACRSRLRNNAVCRRQAQRARMPICSTVKGRRLLEKRTVDSVQQSKEYFEQALDLDPAFARAWVGLGRAFSGLTALAAVRAADGYPRARAAAERALEIDPDLAEAHVCLATALSTYDWDFEGAARHYRRALELNPSHADAHRLYAEHLRFQGRFDEALEETQQAVELDPAFIGSPD